MDRDESELLRDSFVEDNDDDDLDFHMTFPSPSATFCYSDADDDGDGEGGDGGGQGQSQQQQQDFVLVRKEDPEPVVFLLGWAGAQDKLLAKYSKVYEEAGCITVRYTAPADYIFFEPEKLRPVARKLLDLVEEMSLEDNPLFFHAFSNNGSAVYQFMSEALQQDRARRRRSSGEKEEDERAEEQTGGNGGGVREQLRGVIFDSAPGRRTASSFLKAASQVFGMVSSPGSSTSLQRRSLFCYDFIKTQDELRLPMLFIFSTTDDVIKAEDIEEVIEAKERQGCEVSKVCYDDSPHVQHLRFHRESYVLSVRSFLNKCLREAKSTTNAAAVPSTRGTAEEASARRSNATATEDSDENN